MSAASARLRSPAASRIRWKKSDLTLPPSRRTGAYGPQRRRLRRARQMAEEANHPARPLFQGVIFREKGLRLRHNVAR
jgi:hypothetical protein